MGPLPSYAAAEAGQAAAPAEQLDQISHGSALIQRQGSCARFRATRVYSGA
jgi:hypothetical protein